MINLTELHERNKRWRAWMDANTPFKTPDTLDCLRYAAGECAEVRDLWMRERLAGHARNNERTSTINQELADVAMMILTVFDPEPHHKGLEHGFNIDFLCDAANEAIIACGQGYDWTYGATEVIAHVLAYPGFNLATELDDCHTRLGLKHGGVTLLHAIAQTGVVPWEAQPLAIMPAVMKNGVNDLMAERNDLAAKLEEAYAELHELRIRAEVP
jgi:hypothetical protein